MITTSNKSKPKKRNTNTRLKPLKCENCGAPITPDAVGCEYCGVSFIVTGDEVENAGVCPIRRLYDNDKPTSKDWFDALRFVITGKETLIYD